VRDDRPDPAGAGAGEHPGVDDPNPEADADSHDDPDGDRDRDRDADPDDEETSDDATDAEAADLTHTDEAGRAGMVDVGAKPDVERRAVARGEIHLRAGTVAAIRGNEVAKGDVLAVARVGAIQAVKRTWDTIPLCHQIPVTSVDAEFDVREDRVVCTVAVETTGKTGCEMEALCGVTTGLNVVWDMVKAAEKDETGEYPATRIEDVRVVEKTKHPPE
jgi:cyclic pyranopterin phosphate synthase